MECTLKVVAVSFVLSVAIGCAKEPEWTGNPRLASPYARRVVAEIHAMTNRLVAMQADQGFPSRDQVVCAISNVSNVDERVALIDELTDSLFAMDVSDLDYRCQSRVLGTVRFLVEQGALTDLSPYYLWKKDSMDSHYEWRYGMLLRQMAWERAQIVRTMPKHRLKDPSVITDREMDAELAAWREIHYGGIEHYEFRLRHIERWLRGDKQKMSNEAWGRIKARVEEHVGRPLRTVEQLNDDAVKNRHVEFIERKNDCAAP